MMKPRTTTVSPSPQKVSPSTPPLEPAANAKSTNVRVMVRVRPFSNTEIALGDPTLDPPVTSCVYVSENDTVTVLDGNSGDTKEAFKYDRVFWSVTEDQKQEIGPATTFASQQDVFVECGEPVIQAVYEGMNSCIFAYGQTGSGKTHTMMGSANDPGLIPRIIGKLFDEAVNVPPHIELTISASFMEIYNEKVKDLLDAADHKMLAKDAAFAERKVRYSPEMGTYVAGLNRTPIASAAECEKVISAGTAYRTTASTKMNDQSSRSHAILQLHLRRKDTHAGLLQTAMLNLVDLAGSERIRMSGVSGQQLQEAKNINLSLSTLRRVIDTLIENSKRSPTQRKAVAPYRESMLTWVLSDSLGGNCITTMLGTVSPHVRNTEDTLNTLRYALKAKSITCVVKVNTEKCAVVVKALKEEMESIKMQLSMNSFEPGDSVLHHREMELSRRNDEAAKHNSNLLRKQSVLKAQVTKQRSELTRLQSSLDVKMKAKTDMSEMADAVEEAMAMHEQQTQMIEEEELMRDRANSEIRMIQVYENEIIRLQDAVAGQKQLALEYMNREKQKAFKEIFTAATSFGRDRQSMRGIENEFAKLREEQERLLYRDARNESRGNTVRDETNRLNELVKMMNARVIDLTDRMDDTLRYKSNRMKATVLDTTDSGSELKQVQAQLAEVNEKIDEMYSAVEVAAGEREQRYAEVQQRTKDVKTNNVDIGLEVDAAQRAVRRDEKTSDHRSSEIDSMLVKIQEHKAERDDLAEEEAELLREIEALEVHVADVEDEANIVGERVEHFGHRIKKEDEQRGKYPAWINAAQNYVIDTKPYLAHEAEEHASGAARLRAESPEPTPRAGGRSPMRSRPGTPRNGLSPSRTSTPGTPRVGTPRSGTAGQRLDGGEVLYRQRFSGRRPSTGASSSPPPVPMLPLHNVPQGGNDVLSPPPPMPKSTFASGTPRGSSFERTRSRVSINEATAGSPVLRRLASSLPT